MKTILTFATILLFQSCWSQRLYGSAAIGYQSILNQDQPPSYIVNTYHQISNPWFWGEENPEFQHMLTSDLTLGWMFRNQLGIEVTGSYLKPQTQIENYGDYLDKQFKGDFWRINPKLVIALPIKKLDLCMKMGPLIGSGKMEFYQRFQNDGSWNLGYQEAEMTYEYTQPVSLGFSSSICVSKRILNNLELFSEIQFNYQTISPTKGKLTMFKLDGKEQSEASFNAYSSQIQFGDESEWYYWHSEDSSQPQKLYKRTYSLTGFALTVGCKFTIWRKGDGELK